MNNDGNKNVYVWFKDAANNVSSMATDSVIINKVF